MRYLIAALLAGGFLLAELLLGGTRLVFSLPAYALLCLAALLTLFSFKDSELLPDGRCLGATIALFGYVLLRQLTSPVEYLARFDLLLVIASLLVYFLISTPLSGSRYRWTVIAVLLVLAFANIGLAGFQFLTGETPAIFGLEKPAYGARASGLYVCPNHLAGFLEVTTLFALGVALWSRRSVWLKVAAGYIAAIGLVAVLVTGSRGGMAGMAVGLAVFAAISLSVLRRARPERFGLAATFAAIAGIALVATLGTFAVRHYALQARSFTAVEDAHGRLALWQPTLEQFRLSPVTGTGSGTFYLYGQMFRNPANPINPEYAHNDYLQYLAEFGVVGFILLVVFLMVHVRRGWRSVFSLAAERSSSITVQSDRLAFAIAALSAISTYMIHSAVDFNLHIPANAMLMALCFGIVASGGVVTADESRHHGWKWFGRFVLPGLALWMALAGLKTWPAEYYGERARLALRNQQYPASAALATEALKHDNTNPFLWLYLGQAQAEMASTAMGHERTNAWFGATEAFSSGLKLFPQERWLLLGMAEALDGLGRFPEAEGYYQQALECDPKSAEVRALYALHLQTSGRTAEAEDHFKRSLALRYTFAAANGLERLMNQRAASGAP